MWCLLEAVKCFVEQEDSIGMIYVDEAFGLVEVYVEVAFAVEKRVFAVHLDDVEIVHCADRE